MSSQDLIKWEIMGGIGIFFDDFRGISISPMLLQCFISESRYEGVSKEVYRIFYIVSFNFNSGTSR